MQPQLPPDFLQQFQDLRNRVAIAEKALTNDALQVGTIIQWTGPNSLLPFNYMPADGRAIDRVGYAAYFAQVNTTYGIGDGSTSFNIPNEGPRIYIDAGTTRAGCVALDGASYLRATFPDLFTYLGGASSPWGLPDGTHFNVPDMRGRSPMGVGTGTATGATAHTLAQLTGEETHTLTTAEMPSHFHSIARVVNAPIAGGDLGGAGSYNESTVNTDSKGSSAAHNNLTPSTVFNFFIETSINAAVKVL